MEHKTLVRIIAQTFENYSDNDTPYWKPKGGQEFTLRANADFFMYEKELCLEVIKKMLVEKSNPHMRFEYVDHQLVFHEPIVLDEQAFARGITETLITSEPEN